MTKVIVTQYGARRRYLIPQVLYKNNMLECLYTDSCRVSLLGKMIFFLSKLGICSTSLNRLIRRNPNLPKDKIKTNDLLQCKLFWQRITKTSKVKSMHTIFVNNAPQFKRWGCREANWLYAMYIESFDYTKYAKSKGLKVLADIYENPYIFRDLADEVTQLPELICVSHLKVDFMAKYNLRIQYIDRLLEIADQYLIPSHYVAECLRSNSSSFDENKVNIIPYASSLAIEKYNNQPVKGRIIWIGNDPVRKGLVYSLRAVKELKLKYPYLDFRVIGSMPEEIVKSEDFKCLNFLGYQNKEQLKEEFRLADMYVFPTLAEGFAGSLLEAAGFGVPIITTHASGFGADFPGIFIKERNAVDIVNAVSLLLENRGKRDEISRKIYSYAQTYDKNCFESNLITLLKTK